MEPNDSFSSLSSNLDLKSKKIIDYQSMERYTECAFCLERFREPRILPCSHTYCTPCLNKMHNLQANSIKCAQCLIEHKLDSASGVHVFPKNLALQQLIELKPTELISFKQCDSCNVNYAFTTCLHCAKVICLECKESHLNEFKDSLVTGLFQELICRCNSMIDSLKNDINSFLINCNNVKLSISKASEAIINEIRMNEKILNDSVNILIEKKME